MKKTILGAVAAALFGAVTVAPTPASAFVWVALPMVLEMKKDPNLKPVNPYQQKATKVSKRKSKRS